MIDSAIEASAEPSAMPDWEDKALNALAWGTLAKAAKALRSSRHQNDRERILA